MFRISGLFILIPTLVLLVISFFVLFTLRKVETQGLKAFGYAITVLLWITAALVFSAGIYNLSLGRYGLMPMMGSPYGKMGSYHGLMDDPHRGIMKKGMSGMMRSKCPAMKEEDTQTKMPQDMEKAHEQMMK